MDGAYKNGIKTHYDNLMLNDLTDATGKWDFTTSVLPIDTTFFNADEFRVFLHNPSDAPIYIKSLDVSLNMTTMQGRGWIAKNVITHPTP